MFAITATQGLLTHPQWANLFSHRGLLAHTSQAASQSSHHSTGHRRHSDRASDSAQSHGSCETWASAFPLAQTRPPRHCCLLVTSGSRGCTDPKQAKVLVSASPAEGPDASTLQGQGAQLRVARRVRLSLPVALKHRGCRNAGIQG